MDVSLILLIAGILLLALSFFVDSGSKKQREELEKVSISLHQETSNLKKRIRAIEEELMIASPMASPAVRPAKQKPVHAIIVSQIHSLHSQGYSISEIAKRSSLSEFEVEQVLQSKGVK